MELEYLKQVLDTDLFVKVPRPRDSELERMYLFGFESNYHLLLPVYPLT